MKHVIIVGNVVDGLSFIGPFDSNSKALDYGQGLIDEWHVAEMQEPSVDCGVSEMEGG